MHGKPEIEASQRTLRSRQRQQAILERGLLYCVPAIELEVGASPSCISMINVDGGDFSVTFPERNLD